MQQNHQHLKVIYQNRRLKDLNLVIETHVNKDVSLKEKKDSTSDFP